MPRSKKTIAPAKNTSSQDRKKDVGAMVASVGDQKNLGTHHSGVAPLAPIIAEIRYWHRQRVFAMDQRKRSDMALGAFLRTQLGWSRTLPKVEAANVVKQAAGLIALGEKVAKGKETGIGNTAFGQWSPVILASIQGRAHWDAIEAAATKEMERLASSLPVWAEFGEGVKGFGARSLAVIIGEAGDIGSYASVAKLWKRMGLAVMNGVRQGGLRKTASADDWIAHGYSARRRSYMFVIGDVLVKQKARPGDNTALYRDVYLARKEYEREQARARGLTVAPAAKIPAKRKDEFISDGHIHKRAQRYMEKRLLKHLWQAWRRTVPGVVPGLDLSAATSSAQAERSATALASTTSRLPSASIRQTKVKSNTKSSASGKMRSADALASPEAGSPGASIPGKAARRKVIA